jgi:hypothetical protein
MKHLIHPALLMALVAWGCDGGGGTGDDGTDVPDAIDTSMDTLADTPGDTPGDTAEDPADVDEECPDMIGSPCTGNWDCQDCSYCNGVEVCVEHICQVGSAIDCTDTHECTADSCDEGTEGCEHELDDSLCDDGIACNGAEYCDEATGCNDGAPIDCEDGEFCTVDTCLEPTGDCSHEVSDEEICDDLDACTVDACHEDSDSCTNTLIDGDGDTFPPESCGGPDCDDADPTRYPWADESCTDGIDSNCNGLPDVSDPVCCTGSGDTCDCPVDMSMGGTLTGTTAGMANDYCGTCGASPCGFDGADVAFYLSVPETSLVRMSFSGMSWSWYAHLHEGGCTGTEVLCSRSTSIPGGVLTEILDPGYYFLILDAPDLFSTGAYSITTTTSPVTRVSGNDTCSLAAAVTSGTTYAGTLTGLSDDYIPSCTWYSSGNDAVFRLDLASSRTVTLTTDGTGWDTILQILDSACTDTGLPCDDNGGSGSGTSRIVTTLPAGTYYIVVDETWLGAGADYLLTVNIS